MNDANYESFRNRAAGIQSYVFTAALLVGGLWTLYRFSALDLKQAEKELFEQATIDITIEAQQENLDTGEMCVAAIVTITNTGKRNVFLNHEGFPLHVTRNAFDDREMPVELTRPYPASYRVLRAGETVSAPFVVLVPLPGIYEIYFEVPLSEAELEEHDRIAERAHAPPRQGKQIVWVGSTYLNVHSGDGTPAR